MLWSDAPAAAPSPRAALQVRALLARLGLHHARKGHRHYRSDVVNAER